MLLDPSSDPEQVTKPLNLSLFKFYRITPISLGDLPRTRFRTSYLFLQWPKKLYIIEDGTQFAFRTVITTSLKFERQNSPQIASV